MVWGYGSVWLGEKHCTSPRLRFLSCTAWSLRAHSDHDHVERTCQIRINQPVRVKVRVRVHHLELAFRYSSPAAALNLLFLLCSGRVGQML